MTQPREYTALCQAFDELPGIGPNAAKRLSRFVLSQPQGAQLESALQQARASLSYCRGCRSYTVGELCDLCADKERSPQLLVLEHSDDVEQYLNSGYQGYFFILHGLLSPMAGIGPQQLGLPQLVERIQALSPETLYLSFSSSVEGRATCQFIEELVKRHTPDLQIRSCQSTQGASE